MSNHPLHRLVPYGLGLGLLIVTAHLGWEMTHGGVVTHHLLARSDLPGISNWWGLLVLPLLGWLSSRVVTARARTVEDAARTAGLAFIGSLLMGVAMAMPFAMGYDSVTPWVFLAALAAGLVVPTYRPEYAFGFVSGMVFVFGPVIPLIAVSIAASISAGAHYLVRPALVSIWGRVRG